MWKYTLFFIIHFNTISNLSGHGFDGNTLVRIPHRPIHKQDKNESWINIQQLQSCVHQQRLRQAKTWQEQLNCFNSKPVQATSSGQTNCHMQLTFSSNNYNSLRCTPDQLFYVLPQASHQDATINQPHGLTFINYDDNQKAIDAGCWAQACTIQKGQVLLRENWDERGQGILVAQVTFQARPLEIYNLDVANNHTYLVTTYNIVTHNSHLGPTLNYNNVTKGCQAAVATGVLTGLANWLGGFGLSIGGEGLLALGFSTTVGAPVLIAVGTVGTGLMAWQAFSWFGNKHVKQSSQFKIPQIHNIWANLNPPDLPCGSSQNTPADTTIPTCEAQKLPQLNKPACENPNQLPAEPATNCQAGGTKETKQNPIISCPTSQQNYVANDISVENAETKTENRESEESNRIISDEEIKKLLKKAKRSAHVTNSVKQYETSGSYKEAESDFFDMKLINIKHYPNETIVGQLPDGRNVNVRPTSEQNVPTIEIINGPNNRIKIRYR